MHILCVRFLTFNCHKNSLKLIVPLLHYTSPQTLIFICPCILNIIPNYNQQDATFLDLFISTDALYFPGGSSAYHQEHITAHAVPSHSRQQQAAVLVDNTWRYMYSYVLLMMGGGAAWNMQSVCTNKQIKKRCNLLVVIWDYIQYRPRQNWGNYYTL